MRKFTVTAALLGLTALGVVVPAATSQAAESVVAGPGCDSKWGPRDGKVYAWDLPHCQGTPLPVPGSGTWGPDANDRASSVMNRGYTGAFGVAQFFEHANQVDGHACLLPGELYVDDLAYSRFSSGAPADNNISSHRWANSGSCAVILT
ncbi:hypothetical protein Sipo8835_31205 [Streptomyces ipomoeae]|jgi:hypothetical protein|uniref:Secreted protein n=2 Tax=Streptomyces ipomoeae TaxID=103232 RepID=L1KW10_9ACTN|nr:hypothetical protein [Streptomyces ipomoeae]EKX64660.1 hypothetical protein STRIP9103_08352 [Streptomyces ipomoeae 91-03]MDX2696074.1 hypothetical protein [Streptomyces ipomoeae]MDX2824830.1 hypothetical protein [Streptomyces ipomoeae]MDX2840311.1 hypothetical protein [Streptomyces ipomoeae]MDX2874065.1 hypothetical protein [Streptomyces ipomoeae]